MSTRNQRRTANKSEKKQAVPEKTVTETTVPTDDVMYRLLDAKIEIPVGLLRQKHIFIATPCYGGQIGEPYFRSMMRLAILCNKFDIKCKPCQFGI